MALGTVSFKGSAVQEFGVEQSDVQKCLVHRVDCGELITEQAKFLPGDYRSIYGTRSEK